MRLVSYNILNGGEGRADPLAEVLIAQRADVVCLVECSNAAVLDRIANRLQMDVAVATRGRDPIALLTRLPIVETIDHAATHGGFTGAMLEAVVQSDFGELPIGVVHLTARASEDCERQREAEVAIILDAFAHHRKANRPHLLVGDFNANSPTQSIDPNRCKPATRDAWQANGGVIPRRAIQSLLSAGYRDSLHAVLGARADSMASFTTRWPGQRVDYIFGFDLELTNAWIETDRLATFASDHYPAGCEFSVAERTS